MATHYEVLGVEARATTSELRAAYVAKARALHPDRHAAAPPAERRRVERAMQEVNAAWTVLNDPSARRDYDASLARHAAASTPSARPAAGGTRASSNDARATGPPPVVLPDFDGAHAGRLPTLVRIAPVVLLLGVLGAIFVFTAFATGHRSVDNPGRNEVEAGTPAVGSCVAILRGIVDIPCDDPQALRVERHAPADDDCRGGTVPLRWDDDTTLCVRPPS